MEKYLVLYSDTFLWFNNHEGILYNCKSTNLLNFECNTLILDYCTEFNNSSNLYSIKINEKHEDDLSLQKWINDIVILRIGYVYLKKNEKDRVIGFPPILNLRNEIEDGVNFEYYTNKIIPSLCIRNISIFLGGECENNDYYKQILYPYNQKEYIDFNAVKFFLCTNNLKHVRQINLICSDIIKYKDFNRITELLESLNVQISYYIHDYQLSSIKEILTLENKSNLEVNFYFSSLQNLEKASSIVDEYEIKQNWIFLIDSEEKLNACADICQEFKISDFEFWPILTDTNESFFRENVYTDISDIEDQKHTKRKIFCNQAINSNFFGSLFVLPTGKVYDNLNFEPLGSMHDNIIGIVSEKITQREISWKKTRDKMEACKECNYRYLCPPPSNYEFYSNKFDMCFREASQ